MSRSVFSVRLTKLRKDKCWTQADMAQELGLSRSTYTCYEIGTSMPSAATLCELADLFDVSLDYLLGRGEDPTLYESSDPTFAAQAHELMEKFRLMDNKKRRAITEMAGMITE